MLLTHLTEVKIGAANVGAAMSKIISYLEKHLGAKLRKLGTEHFHNSQGEGWGERYLIDGTLKCVRFNWQGKKSSSITSVDFWLGNQRDPNFNIKFKDVSLVKSLPTLVAVMKGPKIGSFKIEAEALAEAKKGEFTPQTAVADMISKLEAGRSFNRSEFIMNYHPENAHAYDEFVEKYQDELVVSGKRISLPKGTKLGKSKKVAASGEGGEGSLEVSKGGKHEEYKVEVPEPDGVSYTDSLEHLEGLTQALIKGSFNALFVAGRGGTGKTQTVEQVLHDNGLSDGSGYFKNTGSASPIGVYSLLYKYRKDIILFDDSDGALADQDARNLIKAATDTKKVRKIVWNKKSAGMYDPDDEPARDDDAEGEEAVTADDRIPKYFEFTGQIIFISNLPLNKLDPDGALRTRAFIISIDPTADEILQRMSEILNDIKLEGGLSLTPKERQDVLNVIKAGRRKEEASLRTLVRALGLAASGAPNWQKLVQLYA